MGVHLALIAMTGSRDELASVLAHELAHVTQRHIARSIAASQRSSTLGIAATILAILAASRAANADIAQAAIVGGQAAMAQTQLNFSRDMEREADRQGIALLASAGFAPSGMAGMFEKLDQANRLNDNGSYPYLRSHPLTSERIGEARQRIDGLPFAGEVDASPIQHALMRARARVLMDPGTQAQQRQQALQTRGERSDLPLPDRLGALYGAALASLQMRDGARAEAASLAAVNLLATSPRIEPDARRSLARLQAEVALARGDAAAANTALADDAADGSRAGLLLRARVALASREADSLRRSSDSLQVWVAEHRQDAGAWQALSQMASQQGQPLRALRADAESHAAIGDLRGAIDRLRAGQQAAQRGGPGTDFIEASVIDARLRDLTSQRRALQQAQRKAGGGGPGGNPDD